MSEREFWIAVRRGLLLVIRAIEERYNLTDSTRPPSA